MDAIVRYLPSPLDVAPPRGIAVRKGKAVDDGDVTVDAKAWPSLAALAFKVQHDAGRGPLVYLRVYAGSLLNKMALVNTNTGHRERTTKLLRMNADEQTEVDVVPTGNIVAAVGLKHTRTGDTLCAFGDPNSVRLAGVPLPQPVFTAALEAASASEQTELEAALDRLVREDPSLVVVNDEETGQTLLSGMGELHLDIAVERLRRQFGVGVDMSRVRVAYRETAGLAGEHEFTYDKTLAGKRHFARVCVAVEPCEDLTTAEFHVPTQTVHDLTALVPGATAAGVTALNDAVTDSVAHAFNKGPLLGYPLTGLRLALVPERCGVSEDTTPAALRGAVAGAVTAAVEALEPTLLEPVMAVELQLPQWAVGTVVNQLSSHNRGVVRSIEAVAGGERSLVCATVPLSEMIGYSTTVRSKTAGEGSFTMEFSQYQPVGPLLQQQLLDNPF